MLAVSVVLMANSVLASVESFDVFLHLLLCCCCFWTKKTTSKWIQESRFIF